MKARQYVQNNGIVFKHVWIVYDTDDFPAENIDMVAQLCEEYSAQGETIYHAVWSNQCVELWYLLHFMYMDTDIDRSRYWPKLSDWLKNIGAGSYEKNRPDMYEVLRDNQQEGIDTIMSLKKKIAAAFIACAMTLAVVPSAFACTALYVGSDLTEDGTTMFGRIEDLGTNDYNKLFNISPAGKHTAGEVYEGCYGFTYTFTHDSYRYTARRDDNGLGVCPDCDSTHEHTPYEEAGTNEKGVMVSATESLYGTDAVLSVDPYVDNGIEEAEITTVLLSEASTAREGVALLTSIYDNAGAAGGSGVFIADQNETWFVENLTGHTYLALKLSSSVVFMQPNIAAMGKIDLDDTDHVVASANLISVAQKAGTFVGDAAANVIDLDASYNGDIASDRMAAGLNYLYGTDTFTKDNYSETDFAISNVGENGAIVPVYSNIQLTKKFSVEDSIHFFQTEPIGKTGNVETHLFQVSATGDLNTAITEWTAFDDDVYNAFVPYYPMLTTDTADVYKVSVHKVTRSDEQPTEGVWYQDAKGRYYTYPDDWTDSFYGVRDALSNLLTYGSNGNQVTAKDREAAKASYAALQQEIMADYADMKAAVAAADTLEAKQAAATNASNAMSQKVYNTTLKMYNKLQAKTAARAWVSSLLH